MQYILRDDPELFCIKSVNKNTVSQNFFLKKDG